MTRIIIWTPQKEVLKQFRVLSQKTLKWKTLWTVGRINRLLKKGERNAKKERSVLKKLNGLVHLCLLPLGVKEELVLRIVLKVRLRTVNVSNLLQLARHHQNAETLKTVAEVVAAAREVLGSVISTQPKK